MKIKIEVQVVKNDNGTFSARLKNNTDTSQENMKGVELSEISDRVLEMLEEFDDEGLISNK